MYNVVCVFTCFNRKNKTVNAYKKLNKNNNKMYFVIVDDNSSDGTSDELRKFNNNITILYGDGSSFYGGGMRTGMEYLLSNNMEFDYLLLVNDDVDFYENIVDKMIDFSKKNNESVIVGPTHNTYNKLSYGGIKNKSKFSTKYFKVGPDNRIKCDTFNGNCVLIPYYIFKEVGSYDKNFIHNFAEFDYGHTISKKSYDIITFNEFVGVCNNNTIDGTWYDTRLSRLERLKKKESSKGAPLKVVFYYYKKNFNIFMAIRCSISGYLRILFNRKTN